MKSNLKTALNTIKSNNPDIYDVLSGQSKRIFNAMDSILVWIESELDKNPLMITGNSGSSKSFITKRFFEGLYGKDKVIYTLPPSNGNYEDVIQQAIDKKPKFKFILIDESHSLDFDIESIQPESSGVMIAERFIRKNQLVFISHQGLGSDSSQDARLEPVEFGQIPRDEIIDILINKYGFSEDCAEWSAWHSPRNIHNAIQNSKYFGTSQQASKNPCGLRQLDIDVLRYYKNSYQSNTNTVTGCSNKLCVNVKTVKDCERRLSGEGFLSVGNQCRRFLSELGLDLIYTIDETKPEPKQDTKPKQDTSAKQPTKSKTSAKPKQSSKTQSKRKTSAKQSKRKAQTSAKQSKRKTSAKPKSKTDTVKADKSPNQLHVEIASEIIRPVDKLHDVGNME